MEGGFCEIVRQGYATFQSLGQEGFYLHWITSSKRTGIDYVRKAVELCGSCELIDQCMPETNQRGLFSHRRLFSEP